MPFRCQARRRDSAKGHPEDVFSESRPSRRHSAGLALVPYPAPRQFHLKSVLQLSSPVVWCCRVAGAPTGPGSIAVRGLYRPRGCCVCAKFVSLRASHADFFTIVHATDPCGVIGLDNNHKSPDSRCPARMPRVAARTWSIVVLWICCVVTLVFRQAVDGWGSDAA
jgi:hypothetical protein